MKEKIIYIANARIPTEKAHGVQIMKMCEAFANAGSKVELAIPSRFNKILGDPFAFYGVKKNFEIKKVFSLDLMPAEKLFGRMAFYAQALSFAFFAKRRARKSGADFIYCRDLILLPSLIKTGKKVIFEAHVFPEKAGEDLVELWKKCHKIIVITGGLKKLFVEKGVEEERVLIAPDGVDLEKFKIQNSKLEVRNKFGLPEDKKIVMYTGHLYLWKGIDTLIESAQRLKDYLFVFVGGTEKDVEIFKIKTEGSENILALGHHPHGEIPYFQKAADILVLPNTAKEKISSVYTSPLKLFEYMASGAPIIASNLPSIREILNEDTAWFFEADNAKSLAGTIKEAVESEGESRKKAEKALEEVEKYTWDKRAENILSFIYGKSN
jgi:glycosyltransferase involved in cell wall biosynthesis